MDADPWADAPPCPRPSSSRPSSPAKFPLPQSPSSPASTSKPVLPTSPLARQDPSFSPAPTFAPPPPAGIEEAVGDDGFDDFDDFDEPGPSGGNGGDAAGEDDGFGDFGEFEEGDFEEQPAAPVEEVREMRVEEPRLQALRLRPFPPAPELLDQLSRLLAPYMQGAEGQMTEEPPRTTGGLGQIMSAESSRDAYAQLTTAPILKPLDWTRSKVRRDHLISMGVPVNLDEVDAHRLSALPPLRITTQPLPSSSSSSMGPPSHIPPRRPQSMDANGRPGDVKGKGRETSIPGQTNGAATAPVSAVPGDASRKYGLGARPEMDASRAEELCGLEEDQLSLLSLERLKALQQELVDTSAQASSQLAWLLQLKDAQSQDSATYNGMISELIANAAKAKSAQAVGSGGVFRRGSTRRPASASGTATPGRVGSPGMR